MSSLFHVAALARFEYVAELSRVPFSSTRLNSAKPVSFSAAALIVSNCELLTMFPSMTCTCGAITVGFAGAALAAAGAGAAIAAAVTFFLMAKMRLFNTGTRFVMDINFAPAFSPLLFSPFVLALAPRARASSARKHASISSLIDRRRAISFSTRRTDSNVVVADSSSSPPYLACRPVGRARVTERTASSVVVERARTPLNRARLVKRVHTL